jgi:DNA-binding MarR family transcriptional regulator
MMAHPALRLDNAVHQRTRLGILTILAGADRADFSFLRDTLDLTDGNLSRNLTVLENAGFVAIDKTFEGRRPRTWISVTPAGQKALAEEIQALREIVQAVEGQPTAAPRSRPQPGPAIP